MARSVIVSLAEYLDGSGLGQSRAAAMRVVC